MKNYKGYIRYFDSLSGVGIIVVPKLNKQYKVHYTASENFDGDFTKFCNESFDNHTPVECAIYNDSHWSQIQSFKVSNYCTIEEIKSDIILGILERNENNIDFYLNNFI